MSVQRVFHCDWRECECHARSHGDTPPSSFIAVNEDLGHQQHFCSWDCLLKFAAEKSPTELVMGEIA